MTLVALEHKHGDLDVIKFNTGILALQETKFEKGAKIAMELLESNPENWRYHRLRSECLFALGLFDDALISVERSFYHYPTASTAHLQAQILLGLGNVNGALEVIKIAVEMEPSNNVREFYADIMAMNELYLDAANEYSSLLQSKPSIEVRRKRGKCFYAIDEYENALVDFIAVHREKMNNETRPDF